MARFHRLAQRMPHADRSHRDDRSRFGVLDRYLLDGERIVTAVHQHGAKVAEPVASVVAALVLVLVLDASLPPRFGLLANLLWWAWFVVVGRTIWKILEWRHDWFVATDKRLILTYGLITQKVAMMPLTKVTDMSYNRSPLGRLLGFGTFVMESAGQDQALHSVHWVPDPDHTYRAICAEIFGVDDHDRVVDEAGHDPRPGGDPLRTGVDPSTYPTAIRIRPGFPGGPDKDDRDRGDRGERDRAERDPGDWDPEGPDIHQADTGPIPYGS